MVSNEPQNLIKNHHKELLLFSEIGPMLWPLLISIPRSAPEMIDISTFAHVFGQLVRTR
jgi:hypothetical protein